MQSKGPKKKGSVVESNRQGWQGADLHWYTDAHRLLFAESARLLTSCPSVEVSMNVEESDGTGSGDYVPEAVAAPAFVGRVRGRWAQKTSSQHQGRFRGPSECYQRCRVCSQLSKQLK